MGYQVGMDLVGFLKVLKVFYVARNVLSELARFCHNER